ncbi:hypothetical protein FPV67DRAFT_509767 [Lyophyllum atratum]|nr:hypothetical protein FPV67DRAFT_509767 [Lyophyllum atratum]
MSVHASSGSPLPSQTSSGQVVPQTDTRVNVVGIVLGVVGVLLVAGVIYATLRMKRRRSSNDGDGTESFASPALGRTLDQSHPAARITPFGSPGGETPRFKHTPGADMRIAMRRPDGAWQFGDTRRPFTPSGVSEIDVLPSPSSSTGLLPPRVRKEHEAKASRDLRYGHDHDYDIDINPPPPAYGYDYSGYLPHVKN